VGSSRYCKCTYPYVWPEVRNPEWIGCQTKETAKKLKECQDKESKCFLRLTIAIESLNMMINVNSGQRKTMLSI
jgi:hypothetical protein